MASAMTPRLSGESGHLSVDDLLGPLPETFRLSGPGPFVINLQASSISMRSTPNSLPGFDNLHLYQIQRMEDEVRRYRLRLGAFTSEEEANAILVRVRDNYPCALTATAGADDLQAIESLHKPKTQPNPAQAPIAVAPVLVPAPVIAAAPVVVPVTAAQTLRWFVIELSLTQHAIDPETVPNLDIYALYRLYSVTELDQGQLMHSLRLGFFTAEIAAKAVASYLAVYYEKPSIKRVSVAERERFSEQGIEARKDVGATGMHAVIEITSDRLAKPTRTPDRNF